MAKKRLYRCFHYFTRGELALWGTSTALILAFFLAYDRTQFGILAASLIGVTSLIFNAKGNPFGQLLMVCFSALYGIISFSCGYYGEMATYLGMTAPMAVFALVSWLRNPYDGNRAEVQVKRLERRDAVRIVILTVAVTAVFYFILAALHTNRLIPSTLSVATSFLAAFLTFQAPCSRPPMRPTTWSWSCCGDWRRRRTPPIFWSWSASLCSWSTTSMAF